MTTLTDEVLDDLLALDAIVSETRRSRHAAENEDCTSLAHDLQQALGSRSILDQATGMLMTGLGYGAVDAYTLLRRASADSEQAVEIVAQGMVDAEARTRRARTMPARTDSPKR